MPEQSEPYVMTVLSQLDVDDTELDDAPNSVSCVILLLLGSAAAGAAAERFFPLGNPVPPGDNAVAMAPKAGLATTTAATLGGSCEWAAAK